MAVSAVLAAWGGSPAASADAAPAGPAQGACPTSVAGCACRTPGWWRVGGLPVGFSVNTLGYVPDLGRIYAGTSSTAVGGEVKVFSGTLNDAAWTPLADFQGIAVTDFLASSASPRIGVWSSATGANPVYGATPANPTSFSAQGALGWVTRLAESDAGDVLAASSLPVGVHAWNEAQQRWDARGAGSIPTRAFWAFELSGSRLWLGTDARGVWRSDDDGAEWTVSEGGNAIQRATVTALAVDPADPDRIVIGLGPQADSSLLDPRYRGLRVSTDGGTSWSNPVFESADLIPAVAFSRRAPSRVFAALFGQGIQVSPDGGRAWQTLAVPAHGGVDHKNRFYALLTVEPNGEPDCELLFAGGDGGVWVRDIAGPPARRIFVPFALTLRPSAGLAADGAPGGPPPTPPAVRHALPPVR